ncbi:Flagellin [Thalassocella blandensis]|nr:Flagellin [Thalassocella blandensis]
MEINSSTSNFIPNSLGNINRANDGLAQSAERIASGSRINRASDDVAGFALSERLTRQVDGFSQSIRNANDGVSYLQTADAGLSGISDGIQRIRELALQASNSTLTENDRSVLNEEAQQIKNDIQRTVETSQFNGRQLLTNNDNGLRLQLGPESDDQLQLQLDDVSETLSEFNDLDLSSPQNAQSAINVLDDVQENVVQVRADIGAGLNRIDAAINNLSQSELSAQQSRSRIADADIAKEVSELTVNQIKRDVSIAIQVQANKRGNALLNLLS